MSTGIVVRDVELRDDEGWARLYRGYRGFYRLDADDAKVATTWGWVSRREHGLRGLVVEAPDGGLIALANLRTFARPSSATIGLYLDDLFTAPEARGTGAATALLRRASAIAAEQGASVVRWITDSGNETAQRLYDSVATQTPWITYDLAPSPSPSPAPAGA